MLTLDTSALFASLAERDPDHRRMAAAILAERGPLLVPAATLGELAHLIERELPAATADALVSDFEAGGYVLDCGDRDYPRIRALMRRYADFPLGLVDAAVIVCAERNGGRVLTLDLRHFGVVAGEGTITILP